MIKQCLILCASILLGVARAGAQTVLVADVADAATGAPLHGAEILLPDLKRVARTDWIGEAKVSDIPAGTHRVRVRMLGYAAVDIQYPFKGDTVGPVFKLQRASLTLDTVRSFASAIPSRLRDFEMRRRMAIGRFMTDSALVSNQNQEFGYVAQTHFPGVRLAYDPWGKPILVTNSPCTRGFSSCGSQAACPVRIYLDDSFLGDGALDIIETWDLAGAEFYTSTEVPTQYRVPGSQCGTLLLWSRY